MKALVTLTSSEAKRLVAKGVVRMDIVQRALAEGIIAVDAGSSGAYVSEELAREVNVELAIKDKREWIIGLIAKDGSCLEAVEAWKLPVFVKGKVEYVDFPNENFSKYFPHMGNKDIIIKGGNAVDSSGKAGGLCAANGGGHLGGWISHALVAGINIIVPITLNKTIPTPIERVVSELGRSKIFVKHCHGMTVGMLPMPGIVVREIEALKVLADVEVIPVAGSGIGSGEGTVTLLLQGQETNVDKAWEIVQSVKGEPRLEENRCDCKTCVVPGDPFGLGIQCSTRATKKAGN
jgi:hypothetical protein